MDFRRFSFLILTPNFENMCGQAEQAFFAHFCICGEPAGNGPDLKYTVHKAQPDLKNARENACLLAPFPFVESIFLRPGQGANINLLRGGKRFDAS
jgi:hypothetical protein